MTDHDLGVSLQCATPAGEPGSGGGAPVERPTIQLGAKTDQPPRECARLEEVLSPKDVDPELEACLQADAAGDPHAATNLGVLFEKKGDFEAALAAYRRADRRGDVTGAFNLGCLLADLGDLEGAKSALQRADERGDAAGASNLGVLLEEEGDLDGALAAYRRAEARGDAAGAYNLGLLLARQSTDEAEAEITVEEPQVAVPELPDRSRTGWIVALALLVLVGVVIARRRRATSTRRSSYRGAAGR